MILHPPKVRIKLPWIDPHSFSEADLLVPRDNFIDLNMEFRNYLTSKELRTRFARTISRNLIALEGARRIAGKQIFDFHRQLRLQVLLRHFDAHEGDLRAPIELWDEYIHRLTEMDVHWHYTFTNASPYFKRGDAPSFLLDSGLSNGLFRQYLRQWAFPASILRAPRLYTELESMAQLPFCKAFARALRAYGRREPLEVYGLPLREKAPRDILARHCPGVVIGRWEPPPGTTCAPPRKRLRILRQRLASQGGAALKIVWRPHPQLLAKRQAGENIKRLVHRLEAETIPTALSLQIAFPQWDTHANSALFFAMDQVLQLQDHITRFDADLSVSLSTSKRSDPCQWLMEQRQSQMLSEFYRVQIEAELKKNSTFAPRLFSIDKIASQSKILLQTMPGARVASRYPLDIVAHLFKASHTARNGRPSLKAPPRMPRTTFAAGRKRSYMFFPNSPLVFEDNPENIILKEAIRFFLKPRPLGAYLQRFNRAKNSALDMLDLLLAQGTVQTARTRAASVI